MAPQQQTAHAQVGLLLTQVRGDFLRASTSDPESSARAAKALRRAFELLNIRSRQGTAGGCGEDCGENGQALEGSRAFGAVTCHMIAWSHGLMVPLDQ